MKTYLDYAATTPVHPEVLEAMLPYFTGLFANPSSIHTPGQQAENVLESARETIAELVNAKPNEIVFTSCGSESDNLALRGTAFAARRDRKANHILISPVEHHAVLHTALQLSELHGFELEYLPVDTYGMVSPEDVYHLLRPDTAVVSIIMANNEIGTINPISEISAVCREKGVPFHTDAVQAGAHLALDVQSLGIDLLSLGAHKFYGPKGVGALYVREGTPLVPIQTGGGQEFGLRAGTSNVPYIAGMAKAFEIVYGDMEKNHAHVSPLRDRVIGRVLEEIPDSALTGHPQRRLPNHTSFVFKGVDGNALLMSLDLQGFACSSGSACKTGLPEPSEVLLSIGFPPDWALGSLRVTLGNHTQAEEVEHFLNILPGTVERVRSF